MCDHSLILLKDMKDFIAKTEDKFIPDEVVLVTLDVNAVSCIMMQEHV